MAKFVRPPEGPTFCPSEEEFQDPLSYINRIRPTAEKYGICKVKPPKGWDPPFALDLDKFRFVPRVQKINELEATTRIKLNFLDELIKFWDLHGNPLQIPFIGQRPVDLYTLHQLVSSNEFKNSKLVNKKKWSMIAKKMGFPSTGKLNAGPDLEAQCKKLLYPYNTWKTEQSEKKNERVEVPLTTNRKTKMKSTNCKISNTGKREVFCCGCQASYHKTCLKAPVNLILEGKWWCPSCLSEKLSSSDYSDEFGFVDASQEYTLPQFGTFANEFKLAHFNKAVDMVSSEAVEAEFWRIVSRIESNVTVEYGADLHSMDLGSGFPTATSCSSGCSRQEESYMTSPWNLNNLPVQPGSVFRHISANISGMKVPWLYVGMCFSTFCWHNEDHWSYSISYLHQGEPKTWYGVPGEKADDLERVMRSEAPALFQNSPDLLHQLVTLMNPNILMKAGIPVYRMDQHKGEFIITFPRAYHQGFNQGFNFAEAVNFAPADWIHLGRNCVDHYAELKRFCVFSHDEVMCSMAQEPNKLDLTLAIAVRKDVAKMVENERRLRKMAMMSKGKTQRIKVSKMMEFEKLADDGRQCAVCKTTLYLSAVVCCHSPDKFVCLKHFEEYGCLDCEKKPGNFVLRYRHSIDDLEKLLTGLELRTENYEKWLTTLSVGLSGECGRMLTLGEVRDLVNKAHKNNYPYPADLKAAAQKLMTSAEQAAKPALIGTSSVRTRLLQKRSSAGGEGETSSSKERKREKL